MAGFFSRIRMEKRVLVASNRGPVSYWFGVDGTLIGRRGGGGLIAGITSGLGALATEADVSWICAAFTDADRAAARQWGADPQDPQDPPFPFPPGILGSPDASVLRDTRIADDGDVTVRMLDIPPDTFHRAYNNVANSTLWFLHHLLFDTPNKPLFGHEFRRNWESYLAYNQAFADAVAEEALAGRTGGEQPASAGVDALIQRGGGIGPAKPRQPIAHLCPFRVAQVKVAGRVTWCQVRPAVKATDGKDGEGSPRR